MTSTDKETTGPRTTGPSDFNPSAISAFSAVKNPTPFYASPEARASLSAEAHRWIGTPFRAASRVPGPRGGVDCVQLCAAIHAACGVCEPLALPSAPLQWHHHHDESLLLEWFRSPEVRARVHRLDEADDWMAGDLVAIRTDLCAHHLGTWLDDELGRHLLHVPIGGTVQRWPLHHRALRGRVAARWRIYA